MFLFFIRLPPAPPAFPLGPVAVGSGAARLSSPPAPLRAASASGQLRSRVPSCAATRSVGDDPAGRDPPTDARRLGAPPSACPGTTAVSAPPHPPPRPVLPAARGPRAARGGVMGRRGFRPGGRPWRPPDRPALRAGALTLAAARPPPPPASSASAHRYAWTARLETRSGRR